MDQLNLTRVNEDLQCTLKKIVLDAWGSTDPHEYFPAPQPVSLRRSDLYKLTRYDYLVCAKSDGTRVLIVSYSNNNYICDRMFQFYKTNVKFNTQPVQGTNVSAILDGELIRNKHGVMHCIVHDIIVFNDKNLFHDSFPSRYSYADKLLNPECYTPKPTDDFTIIKKKFFSFSDLDTLDSMIMHGKIDYNVDGIIFISKYKSIGIYTQYTMFKWKPRELHTVDFKVIVDAQGVTAHAGKANTYVPFATAPLDSDSEKMFVGELAKNCPGFKNGDIVECKYDIINDIFTPVKLRKDKSHPNSLNTVNKTLMNIKEDITMKELIHTQKRRT